MALSFKVPASPKLTMPKTVLGAQNSLAGQIKADATVGGMGSKTATPEREALDEAQKCVTPGGTPFTQH